MRIRCHRLLAVLLLGCGFLAALAPAPAGDKKEYGLAVGQKMPFHVVDFAFGPHKGKGGCPSVMISNGQTRGVILWARTPDEAFFQLAKRLQEPIAKHPKAQGHLVVLEKQGDLFDQATKHGLERFEVGVMRGQSQQNVKSLGALAESDLAVFFLDLKTIKATWSLKSKDLNKETSDKIVGAAQKFFATKDELK